MLEDRAQIDVVGETQNGRKALRMIEQLHPDVVLIDILTTCDLLEYRDAAIDNGASGYVVKHTLHEVLLPTIRDARARQLSAL